MATGNNQPTPIPVELVSVDDALKDAIQPQQPGAIPPNTTAEENLHSASQRRVNMVWEYTQSLIALMVVATTMIIVVILVYRTEYDKALQLLSSMVFLILGFYYGRTNHEKVGGVTLPYQGR